MKSLILNSLLLLIFCNIPAVAISSPAEQGIVNFNFCSVNPDNIGDDAVGKIQLRQDAALIAYCQPKKPFAVRHPRLHKVGRKIRKTCQILHPIVSFLGAASQISLAFR